MRPDEKTYGKKGRNGEKEQKSGREREKDRKRVRD